MVNKAETSTPISAARFVFTTYDELFGRVQFILKSIFVVSGVTAALVSAVFQYQSQFLRSDVASSVKIAQLVTFVLPFYVGPVEL